MTDETEFMQGFRGIESLKKSLAQDPKKQFLDQRGQVRTQSLFFETNTTDFEPMYTLRPYDLDGLPSLKRLYIECRDLTGYLFAEKYLYDYKHLQRLKNAKQFAHHLDEWEEELNILMEAEAIQNLVVTSKTPGPQGLQAAKFLAQKGWQSGTKGRPKKEDVQKEVKRQANKRKDLEEAKARIKKRD